MKHWAWVVAVIAALGCSKPAAPPTESSPAAAGSGSSSAQPAPPPAADAATVPVAVTPDAAAAAPSPESPEARARALLAKQVELLPAGDDVLASMFTKDAVVLTPVAWPLDDMTIDDPSIDLAQAVARMTPHAALDKKQLTKVVAGGNANMIWLAAELELATTARESGESKARKKSRVVRVLELLDAASGWKVAAASFGDVKPLNEANVFFPIPAQTPPGPLAKLLVSPTGVAAALADDPAVVVQGTDAKEYAVGPAAAKALLATWSKLKLEINPDTGVHEVRGKHWGYAVANVRYTKGDTAYAMSALVIAVPTGTTWSVVALHYLPL